MPSMQNNKRITQTINSLVMKGIGKEVFYLRSISIQNNVFKMVSLSDF